MQQAKSTHASLFGSCCAFVEKVNALQAREQIGGGKQVGLEYAWKATCQRALDLSALNRTDLRCVDVVSLQGVECRVTEATK